MNFGHGESRGEECDRRVWLAGDLAVGEAGGPEASGLEVGVLAAVALERLSGRVVRESIAVEGAESACRDASRHGPTGDAGRGEVRLRDQAKLAGRDLGDRSVAMQNVTLGGRWIGAC